MFLSVHTLWKSGFLSLYAIEKLGIAFHAQTTVFQFSQLPGSTTTDLNSLFKFCPGKQLYCTHFTAFPAYLTEAQRYLCNKMDYSFDLLFHSTDWPGQKASDILPETAHDNHHSQIKLSTVQRLLSLTYWMVQLKYKVTSTSSHMLWNDFDLLVIGWMNVRYPSQRRFLLT